MDLEISYSERIAGILSELGIASDYGASRGLDLQPEAVELVTARVLANGRELKLVPEAAAAWEAMRSAAAGEGITLLLISGYRSVAYQREILERKQARGEAMDAILRVNAAPGYSEHHTGRAVDIGTPGCPPLQEAFEQTDAFRWLRREAGRFGFHLSFPRDNPHGIIFEPWHWLLGKGGRMRDEG
ncbi:MAG: D-alanyl-D-alanine carboxypeptidase family protein [Verrucomicrobiae bacterium]|nr:D-alanyl-D-alanine carboxypeptidase family protein [Verrucomicrobiae bacterium]